MGAVCRWGSPDHGKPVGKVMNRTSALRGRWAESAAEDYLRDEGLETLQANYRCRHGELDLIMRDGTTLVFVEVRYRRSVDFGSGGESVTVAKQQRMIATARHYLQHTAASEDSVCRFDVVAISNEPGDPEIEWIKDAFDA